MFNPPPYNSNVANILPDYNSNVDNILVYSNNLEVETNNLEVETNILEIETNNFENVPLTPPPVYVYIVIENPIIIENAVINIENNVKKNNMYFLSSTLKTVCLIFLITSLIYIYYSKYMLLIILSITNILSYYGIKKYSYFGIFFLFINLILDILIKIYLIFSNIDKLFYNIVFPVCILINLYIIYLLFKWCVLKYNLSTNELNELQDG